MLKEVTGDILLSTASAIAHGVAPHDNFKQGPPCAARTVARDVQGFSPLLPDLQPQTGRGLVLEGAQFPVIINLFTQEPPTTDQDRPGKASLPNVNHALQALKKELQEHGVKSLALPRLATGVGGLEWEKVYPLLQQALKDLNIPVYIYALYKKGMAAQEA